MHYVTELHGLATMSNWHQHLSLYLMLHAMTMLACLASKFSILFWCDSVVAFAY